MNEMLLGDGGKIENLIHEIRGRQVMLDSDLAKLYGCANGTKTINQAVGRNMDRFPEDFYFQLTEDECLRSQVGTANWGEDEALRFQIEAAKNNRNKTRYLPYAFTEQGVAMLATVLRTPAAASVSINIMRAFVAMRKYISADLIEQKFVNQQVVKNTEDIKLLQESFRKFEEKRKVNEVYFDGQIYDAYAKIQEIFSKAKRELVIVDAYADKTILDIIKRLKVKVVIVTRKNNLLTEQDVSKYNRQYANLRVVYDDSFHDRFFVLDDTAVYHCGASVNRVGYKTFAITEVCDGEVREMLVNKIRAIF